MKKKLEFDFVLIHEGQEALIPEGWVEVTRLTAGGFVNSSGETFTNDEVVVLILPKEVLATASKKQIEQEKQEAIQGVLMGQMLKYWPAKK